MFTNDTQRALVAIGGYIVILGTLCFCLIPGLTASMDAAMRSSMFVGFPLFVVIFFLWGGSLFFIFGPFLEMDEKWMANEWRAARCKLSMAICTGAVLAWISAMPMMNATGGNVHTFLFFATWLYAGAVGMVQLMPKFRLPRLKVALVRA